MPSGVAPDVEQQPPVQQPYSQADYIVQNLPPEVSDPAASKGLLVRETETMLRLAYAWGQWDVVESSLKQAYNTLKEVEKQNLPACTLKKRVRKLRGIAKDMLALVDREESAGVPSGGEVGETAGQELQ